MPGFCAATIVLSFVAVELVPHNLLQDGRGVCDPGVARSLCEFAFEARPQNGREQPA